MPDHMNLTLILLTSNKNVAVKETNGVGMAQILKMSQGLIKIYDII